MGDYDFNATQLVRIINKIKIREMGKGGVKTKTLLLVV